jgi:hypothetical protein
LAIKNPDLVGKTVRCPKCSQTFVVAAQATAAAPVLPQPVADLSDPFAGLPSDPPAGDDPFGGLPSDPLGSPVARPQIGGRGRRRQGGSGKWIKPTLIGGGAVAGVAMVIMLVLSLTTGGSANVVDMTYLPANTDLLVHVDLAAWMKSPIFKKQLESPQYAEELKQVEQQTGLTINDLDTLTLGMPSGPDSTNPISKDFVAVLRIKRDFDESRLSANNMTSKIHNGHKIYSDPAGQMALFVADKRTLVFGSMDALKSTLMAETEQRFEKFDFVNHRQDLFVGWVPSNKAVLGQVSSAVPAASSLLGPQSEDVLTVVEVLSSDLRGLAAGANARGSSATVSIQVLCSSSASSGKLKKSLGGLLAQFKKLYKEKRDDVPNDASQMIDPVLNSLRLSKRGEAVTLSFTIPQNDTIDQIIQSAPGFPKPSGGFGRSTRFPFGGSALGGPSSPLNGAQSAATSTQLRKLLLAMHDFHDKHKSLPPARVEGTRPDQTNLSWRVHLLPFIDQQQLHSQFQLDEPWDSPTNRNLISSMPAIYKRVGSGAPEGKTTFLTVDMPKSPFAGGIGVSFREITDGTSNTAMIVVVNDNLAVQWTRPRDYQPPAGDPGSGLFTAPGAQSVLIGFCDGAPRLVTKSDDTLLRNLFQANDGNPVQLK